MNDLTRLIDSAIAHFPRLPPDPIKWGEENMVILSSARSAFFNCEITPWIREPTYRAAQGVWVPDNDLYDYSIEARSITLNKPVQSGGSTFGELMMLYWIMFGRGQLQYNWSTDDKALSRWKTRIDGLLEACKVLKEKRDKLATGKNNDMNIDFGNVYFLMQGVFVPGKLDSDSIPLQINEEIHDWKPGYLSKAENRSTAVWNFKRLNISNSGAKDDQLDKATKGGTNQKWQVKCPGCGKLHVMRTKFDKRRPDLGGLVYDADGCRDSGFMEYNYNKLRPTVHIQMPCGFKVHNEDVITRRALSVSGCYTEPLNTSAELMNRSYSYECVSVDYIDMVDVIKQKHQALKARKMGDIEPWRRYTCERECIAYDPEEVPSVTESIVVTSKAKKNREGLKDEGKIRLFGLDFQRGRYTHNETKHWWMVIRDAVITEKGLKTLLVFEGKLDTNEEVIATMKEYNCEPWHGVADSGDDTTEVYKFCLKNGINAIKGGNKKEGELYLHKDGAFRTYSPGRALHLAFPGLSPLYSTVIGEDGVETNDYREPMFWTYSKGGIRERHFWVKGQTEYLTPEDASDDYRSHHEAEERVERKRPDGSSYFVFEQSRRRNDLYVIECYLVMLMDIGGAIGDHGA